MFKVYLVDDEKPIIDELLSIIDWEGLNCSVCGYNTDSITAMQEIIEKKPDILISDINMRGMNGLELVSFVSKELKDLGVILLSAYDLFDYAAEAIRLRVLSYLVKPVNKRELCQVIKDYQKTRANEIFHDFFRMLKNSSADEGIIKQVQAESVQKGLIKTGESYAFCFMDENESNSKVIAEYKDKEFHLALIKLNGCDDLEHFNKTAFVGGDNLFRSAKLAIDLKSNLPDEHKIKKEIKIAIDKIIQDIGENYHQKISLGYYAEKYHYNLTYLSQQFKYYVGMNFIDYVIKVRLEKAKTFMRDKSLNMNEIAYKLGYDDYSHFSKIFKKYEGMSPADYRKNYC